MKQTNVTLANVLLILAAIGFAFATYLSINFITLGDTMQSLTGALIVSLILAALAFAAQMFKKRDRNFKMSVILEILSLLLFIAVGYFAIQPFSHVFTVFKQKESIENKVVENVNQAQNMFDDYEEYATNRIETYKSTLKSVVAAKQVNPSEYKSYGFGDGRSDNSQVDTKLFTLNAKLFPSNFENDTIQEQSGIKEAAVKWLNGVNRSVKSDFGFTFGIVKIINEVPLKIEGWRTELTEFSSFRAEGETGNTFEYPLDFKTVKDQLTETKSVNTISIVLALFAYLLMLLPYFLAKRSSRFPGIKMTFGGSESSDNEL